MSTETAVNRCACNGFIKRRYDIVNHVVLIAGLIAAIISAKEVDKLSDECYSAHESCSDYPLCEAIIDGCKKHYSRRDCCPDAHLDFWQMSVILFIVSNFFYLLLLSTYCIWEDKFHSIASWYWSKKWANIIIYAGNLYIYGVTFFTSHFEYIIISSDYILIYNFIAFIIHLCLIPLMITSWKEYSAKANVVYQANKNKQREERKKEKYSLEIKYPNGGYNPNNNQEIQLDDDGTTNNVSNTVNNVNVGSAINNNINNYVNSSTNTAETSQIEIDSKQTRL